MSQCPKKAKTSIPFTQLWYNFSIDSTKQLKKQSQAVQAIQRKSYTSDLYPKQRRSSCYIGKKPDPPIYNNDKISMMLLQSEQTPHDNPNTDQPHPHPHTHTHSHNYSHGNLNGNMSTKHGSVNYKNWHGSGSDVVEDSFRRTPGEYGRSCDKKRKEDNVTDRVLKIIQVNVIPFLVEKFGEVEEKMSREIDKLTSIVKYQHKQIQQLKKQFQLQPTPQCPPISQPNKQNQPHNPYLNPHLPFSKQNKPIIPNPTSPLKASTQIQPSNAGCKTGTPRLSPNQLKNRIHTIKTQQSQHQPPQPAISQILQLLSQLCNSLQQTGTKISHIQTQVQGVCERQRASQQKLEKDFAERILQLITTYNDNFVDLDHRIEEVEGFLENRAVKRDGAERRRGGGDRADRGDGGN